MSQKGVFPKQLRVGDFAEASLAAVYLSPRERVARYELEPLDEAEYVLRLEALRGMDGMRFIAPSGLWLSYRVAELEGVDDRLEIILGADESYLRGHAAAMVSLRSKRETVIPEYLVRGLAMGYLDRVGA